MTMRSKLDDQQTPNITTDLKHGLVIGSNLLLGPGGYISLSGPGMLTHQGRCFTFDNSADGFARGEGVGSVKLKVCEDSVEASGRVAMLIGCSVNQDGRSASMTAPHGPSQQEVIRQSMREAGLSPNSITIAECHGTGTALGDPIEIGALRGVMRADRARPILKTSSKTNLGHLEAGAGMAGLIKCICMLNYSSGAPNIHLLVLNPHLDVAGYPVYFESELLDYGSELRERDPFASLRFPGRRGTNARADVWGHDERMKRLLASALVASVAQQSQASVPSCAIVGQGYDDPVVTSVNGGTGVLDASVCQEKCAQHLNCSVFTFYLQGGGCWLQGSGLQPKAIPNAVAGPRSCDAITDASIPRPSPAHPKRTAAPASPSADVAQAEQVRTTTPLPARFIKAGNDVYFVEGSNPRRKHLVRFACFGCEDACSDFVSVSPAYAAALSQDIDFTCSMLDTTTTTVGFLADKGHKEEESRSGVNPWAWPLAIGILLLFCCVFAYFFYDQDSRRKLSHQQLKTGKGRRPSENLPLVTGSSRQGDLPPLPAHLMGPGALPSGAAQGPAGAPEAPKGPRLFAA
ncbi:ppsC [Symbiodinium sp. KB8]|nr:ppsC [Symbiodinium sp. KB8]